MVKLKLYQKIILVGLIFFAVLLSYQDGGSAFLGNDDPKEQSGDVPPPPPIPPPPPPPVQPADEFVEFDKPPMPEGGFSQIQKHLIYPEAARKAGVEGEVMITLKINEKGKIVELAVKKSFGNKECEEAALKAIHAVTWKPAFKDDEPVAVSVTVPVSFRLSEQKIEKKAEKPPLPADGISAIQKNLKYPDEAKESGAEGKVVLKISVDAKGKVVDVEVVDSFDNEACTKAAIDAVKSIKWKPGMKDDNPVDASVTVPVLFKLN